MPGGKEEKVRGGAPGAAEEARAVESCAREAVRLAARAGEEAPPVGRGGGSSAAAVAASTAGKGRVPGGVAGVAGVGALRVVEKATLVRMERSAAEVAGVGAPVELVVEK